MKDPPKGDPHSSLGMWRGPKRDAETEMAYTQSYLIKRGGGASALGPRHIYSRGLLGLCSFRDDTLKPPETGGPRKFRGQMGYGWGHSGRNWVGRG